MTDSTPPVDLARQVLISLVSPSPAGENILAGTQLGAEWLRRQGLAALAWRRWTASQSLPPQLARDLQAAYYVAVADAELHDQELHAVLLALKTQGIAPVVFKGAALAYTVYPDSACRLMSDLDLWLKADELAAAQAILEAGRYRFIPNPDRPPDLMRQNRGEIQLHGLDAMAGLVELHGGILAGEWIQRTTQIDDVGLRSRVVAADLAGHPAFILSPEDSLLQVGVHQAINHSMSAPWLRGLVDIALLARRYAVDWNIIVLRARAWHVATALWLVLSLAVDLAGLEEAREASRQLQPSALRRTLLQRIANAEALIMMRDLSTSKGRYAFLLLLVDRPRDALKLILHTLWPERDWLQARYGRYHWSLRWQHLLNAVRGRI
jgi:hypothetical protein